MRLINYFKGGSFFESVADPIGGQFKVFMEDDNDPDPDVSKADDDSPEVYTDNDEDDPEVSTNDEDSSDNDDSADDESPDDSNDSTSSDDSDDNSDSDDSDSGDDSGDDEEDSSDDMDSDPHDMSGDDEDPDTSSDDSSDEDSSDDSSDEEKGKPGTDFENMRRYRLYKKYMNLYDSVNGYTDTLDALVYDDDEMNTVTKLASSKLKQLAEITYDYMTMKFENDSYTQALLFYKQVNVGVRMCFDLLENRNNNIQKRP